MQTTHAMLHIENLSIAFRSGARSVTPVVKNIDFAVQKNEKVALVGESGSGKSVTALSILRLLDSRITTYPSGKIFFQNKDLLSASEAELRRIRGKHIAMIFQEPMTCLNPVYPIGTQLVEPLQLHENMSYARAKQQMIELLALTGIVEPAKRFDAYPHQLSGGQRQRVMIAMALACHPQLLIADEPTTALDVTTQLQILELLESIQREFSMAILFITHDLTLVRRFADRICVMQQGELVEQAEVKALFENPQHSYTQQLLNCQLTDQPNPLPATLGGEPLLSAREIVCHFPLKEGWFFNQRSRAIAAVDNLSLTVQRGETLGIVGESGSGKTTLGMCLLRLQGCTGDIVFLNQRLNDLSVRALRPLRKEFQVVFQDPYSSLSPRMTVEQIVGEGLGIHFPQLSVVERRARVVRVLEEVGLSEVVLSRYPHEFSGGQRQRIAIARVIILQPKLILLDEPTSALDVSVQKQVLDLLKDLQVRYQMSYLFISHDLKVIRTMAHRVIVMRHGRCVEYAATEELFTAPQQIYTRALLQAALLPS